MTNHREQSAVGDASSEEERAIKDGTSGDSETTDPSSRRSDSSSDNASDDAALKAGYSVKWTQLIKGAHKPIMICIQSVSQTSAKHPRRTIAGVVALSFFLLIVGFATNFKLVLDEKLLWTPTGSDAFHHNEWIENESGFPQSSRYFIMFFHAHGDNVMGMNQVERVFEVMDAVRDMSDYNEVCADEKAASRCEVSGIVGFWGNNSTVYKESVTSHDQLLEEMSETTFQDGSPVALTYIIGYPEYDNTTGNIMAAQSFSLALQVPDTGKAADWELDAVDVVLAFDDQWAMESDNAFRVEVLAQGSLPVEFERAIYKDIVLVPIVFIIMSAFTATVFARNNRIYSRSFLGGGAVFAVLFSIMSGFGLMFIFGVPFTSITQMLPFVVFGIGLDDAFIVMGSYLRTDRSKDPVERIADTFHDIGLSITLTTLTSATAFALGCLSSVPAVYWLCLYSIPMIMIVFFYQLTFFVACIVLDEQRIKERRRDLCICVTVQESYAVDAEGPEEQLSERIMTWYAEKLLRPRVKVCVVIAFAVLAGLSSWSASQLRQEFKLTDILASDSYAGDFTTNFEKYTNGSIDVGIYFRFMDQSNKTVQSDMRKYVSDLAEMDYAVGKPAFFWLEHFDLWASFVPEAQNMTFNEQVDEFLAHPIFKRLYFDDIARDKEGNVVASRTRFVMSVDLESVQEQIAAIETQRDVTQAHSVNQGSDQLSFFTHDKVYSIWEFYSVCVDELILTTIVGVSAVALVALVFIPHWSAVLFVFPFICILYVDLLGVLQWAGLHINALSYVSLAMSIGLLVDFVMHILFRYYESAGNRRQKTLTMLRTMGASILLGGTTTFLGIVPLMFSSSAAFATVFYSFLGIVTLGMGHGLILLPVLLSTFGPEEQISMKAEEALVPSEKEARASPPTVQVTESYEVIYGN